MATCMDSTICLNTSESLHSETESDFNKYMRLHPDAVLLGIDGQWYDVSTFVHSHPGGSFISHLHGQDVTAQVRAFHYTNVLRHRQPVGRYINRRQHVTDAYMKLYDYFQKHDYFKVDYVWYSIKVIVCFLFLLFSLCCIHVCNNITKPPYSNLQHNNIFTSIFNSQIEFAKIQNWAKTVVAVVCGMGVGLFWQQCGFLMHEFMHASVTQKRRIDNFFGMICGTLCIGVNGHWWRQEHFEHHVFTNTCDHVQSYDPQMHEDVWAQDKKLFHNHRHKYFTLNLLQFILIKVQHYTFLPVLFVFGRAGIIFGGFKLERRWYEWTSLFFHFGFTYIILSQFESNFFATIAYSSACLTEGWLHIQLIMSHYAKNWYEIDDLKKQNISWVELMLLTNINVTNSKYTDWLWGGLNHHFEHHLFPLMPRHNLRKASLHVKKLCDDINVEYDSRPPFQIIKCMAQKMKHASKLFKFSTTRTLETD